MKKLLFVVATLLFATSCELIGRIEDWLSPSPAEQELYISLEQEGEPSRVQLDNVGKTVWTAEDKVSVFYNNSGNSCWCYAGETGESSGVFYNQLYVEDGETLKDIVLLYPYAESNSLSVADQCVYVTIPALQHYEKDSYSIGANPMVASGDGDSFELKNVCVRLKLNVTGEKKVVKMTLTGDKGEQMAGRVAINYRDYTLSLIDEGSLSEEECAKQVTLDMGDEGVQLSKTPTAFYFVLAQSELPSAMTLVATYDDGTTRTTKIQKLSGLDIKRPVIGVVIPGVGGDDNGDNGDNGDDNQGGDDNTGGDDNQGGDDNTGLFDPANMPDNEIWYISRNEAIIEPNKPNFDANIVSNTYANGMGVIKFDKNVTEIGEKAFRGSSQLANIILPKTVTKIGNEAFLTCQWLTDLKIPHNVVEIGINAVSGCNRLTSIVIPESVTTIGAAAFSNNYQLADITVGSNVTEIGEGAFRDLRALKSIVLPNGITELSRYLFKGCTSLERVTFGDKIVSIGMQAFHDCLALKELDSPLATTDKRGVVLDGRFCAIAPAGLTEYSIPANTTVIGDYVFYENRELLNITIPNGVTTIEELAFCNVRKLTSIVIPDSVTTIKKAAFSACYNMADVTIGKGVAFLGESAFSGDSNDDRTVCISDLEAWCKIEFVNDDANPLNGCEAIYINGEPVTKLVLPYNPPKYAFCGSCLEGLETTETVEYISEYAFDECDKLTKIDLSKGVNEVKEYAFYRCLAVTDITFSDRLSTIGKYAFAFCKKLAKITFPRNVKSIGAHTFEYCSELKEIYCRPETPPAAPLYYGWEAFGSASLERTIYVHLDSVNAYKTADNWSVYADKIVGQNF